MTTLLEAVIVLLGLGIVSFISYKRRWLDNEGILIALIIGLSSFLLGGWPAFLTLVVFFGAAEIATYFIKGKKNLHHQRNTGNILGNALSSIIALLLQSPVGFFAAMAGSLSDTLSSEIGVLSKSKPILITTLKPVETGMDGAVSRLGLMAALVGAGIIGLVALVFGLGLAQSAIVILAGFFGSLVDSLFGATLQKKGWVDNNIVNFLGSASAALFAFGLGYVIGLG